MRTRRVRPNLLRLEDRTTPAAFEVHGDILYVNGTAGDDSFTFTAGEPTHSVTLNGVTYLVDPVAISAVNFTGHGGHDAAELSTAGGPNTALLRYREGALIGSDYLVGWGDLDTVIVNGKAEDYGILKDSPGNDTFLGTPTQSVLYGPDFLNAVNDFGSVDAFSEAGGSDYAILKDSAGDDTYTAMPSYANLYGDGYGIGVVGFASVDAFSSTGTDTAYFFDSSGDDGFTAFANYAVMNAGGVGVAAVGFEVVNAEFNNNGNDRAYFFGTDGDESFFANDIEATMVYQASRVGVVGAKAVDVDAKGGTDVAVIDDTVGDDTFSADGSLGTLYGQNLTIGTDAFESIKVTSVQGGHDVLHVYPPIDFALEYSGFTLEG
jgi:hypothetical protein